MKNWNEVKNSLHDVSGVEDYENYLFEKAGNGVWYPQIKNQKMKEGIICYGIDINHLLKIKADEIERLNLKDEASKKRSGANKAALLEIVLPLIHSVLILHNHKCKLANYSTTGCDGLLGYSQENIKERIDFYVKKGFHFRKENREVGINLGWTHVVISIWDEGRVFVRQGQHHNLGGIMQDETIQSLIESTARVCAMYTDEWK